VGGTSATILRLVRRELRGGLRGFRVFLACLALGVAAIAAVGTTVTAVREGLSRDARAILGGDVSVRLLYREMTEPEAIWLGQRSLARSEWVELRAMARAVGGDQRTLVEVKAVGSTYPLFGQVRLADGGDLAAALAPGRAGPRVLIAEALTIRLGVGVGGRVRVGDQEFEIGGVIQREPDRGGGALDFGPRLMMRWEDLPATNLVQPGSLVEYHYRYQLADGADLAGWVADLKQAWPEAAWRIRDLRQATPGVERFVQRIGLFLTLVGLTALLVGGVGVGNAVRAFIEGKTTTIATLKCLGAPGGLVFATYFTLVMLLAAGGTLVGLAIGGLAPTVIAGLAGASLPVPIAPGLHPVPLAAAAAFGMLSAAAFSIWPLAQAREVPAASLFRAMVAAVRGWPRPAYIAATAAAGLGLCALAVATAPDQRIALAFVGAAIATFVVLRLVGRAVVVVARRARANDTRLRLALGNLHRPGAATQSVVLSLGLGLTVLVAVATIEGNLEREVTQSLPAKAPAFFFVDIQPDQVAAFEAITAAAAGVTRVERVPSLRGRITRLNGVPVDQVAIDPGVAWALDNERGLTYAAVPPAGSMVVAGDWWPADYRGPPTISFDARLARGMGLGIGDRLTVNVLGRDVEARIANLREINYASLGINFSLIFAPGFLERAPHTHIATVYVDDAGEGPLLKAVTDRFQNVSAIRVRDALDAVVDIVAGIGAAARATAGLTLAAGVLVLAGAIVAGHRRRIQEAVVLKVLGATRADVVGALAIEYGILGLVTSLVAAAAGTLAGWAVITHGMRAEWTFLPQTVASVAVVAAGFTIAAGLAGTWRALGRRPAPVLREA
jgi:putative ABC transport system permease protein